MSGGASSFDRILLQEDIVFGQRVRNFTVDAMDGSTKSLKTIATGGAIGMKRIILLPAEVKGASEVRLTITKAVAEPRIKLVGVYAKCRTA